ncbi:hypothetical protein MSPP1_000183 [Malassezia sp. CBS 17886]|nr:hypothetical protein MSPP1_000183 [Malassezia sp. CBS 17886]
MPAENPPPLSASRRATVVAGIILFIHAAYSAYEYLSQGKSIDLGTASTRYESGIPLDIAGEALLAFGVLTVGCALTAAPLREISWAARTRGENIDCVDGRPSFASVRHRGHVLFAEDM